MALVSLKCQNCGQILEIDGTHDIGFCPYCGSKYQLAEKVKVEHSGTVSLDGVTDFDRLIKKGFACLSAGDEAYARGLFIKAAHQSPDRNFYSFDLDDCDNIYVNIGMLLANAINNKSNYGDDGNKYYYDKIYQHSAEISEEEKLVITDKLAQRALDKYCRFEDLNRIQYIIDNYYRVIRYDFLRAFDCFMLSPGIGGTKLVKRFFNFKRLSHQQVANIVISLMQKQQNAGIKIDKEQYDIILQCLNMEYLAPILTYLMKDISVEKLFHMMISDAMELPRRVDAPNELFLINFPPELLDFFIKNQLSISTPVKTRLVSGYTQVDAYSQEYYVPISDIFMIPPPNDRQLDIIHRHDDNLWHDIDAQQKIKIYKGLKKLLHLHSNPEVSVEYKFPNVTGKEQVNMLIGKYKQALGEDAANNSEHCYIATAVYGSYDCPQVWTLRRYRDMSLAKNFYGRAFIKIYYALSPTAIKLFGKTKWFQHFWKKKLDRMVYKLNRLGFEDTPYNDTK